MSVVTLAPHGARLTPRGRRDPLTRAAERVLLGVCPVVVSLLMLAFQFHIHRVATDFRVAYYPAAERLLHGGDPYAVTRAQLAAGAAFVYPALAAIVFTPFALLGRGPGEVTLALACFACALYALRLLRVRDWRVYGVVMMWLPVYSGWQTANLTLPLMLLIALVWRYRERPLVTGALIAVAISLKPFVWPLALWAVATRRFKASVWALIWGMGLNLLAWGVVGFDRIGEFMRMSTRDTATMWHGGYSIISTLRHVGVARADGEVVMAIVGAAMVLVVLYWGWRGREQQALTVAVVLMLAASPLVWSHYFALLAIPLAIARPRLGLIWMAPIAMWLDTSAKGVIDWQIAIAWGVAALCVRASWHPQALSDDDGASRNGDDGVHRIGVGSTLAVSALRATSPTAHVGIEAGVRP